MKLVCLDLEGVLVPEIWINVAERTGVEALCRTTRDEPDYDALMRFRLDVLGEHRLGLRDIQDTIGTMDPLEGAREFLDRLRERHQVVILSDTIYEFADPLMAKLGRPTLFCHRIETDAADRIVDYHIRLEDQKRRAVEAFRKLSFTVLAAGDSYNDTSMLGAADAGILFCPPDNVIEEFPQFPVTHTYEELDREVREADRRL